MTGPPAIPIEDLDWNGPKLGAGKSAATGREHYFGRLYENTQTCVWCGNPRQHEWHIPEEG